MQPAQILVYFPTLQDMVAVKIRFVMHGFIPYTKKSLIHRLNYFIEDTYAI